MKIGLWNIDHPELHPTSPRRRKLFERVESYLIERRYHIYVLTESNSAMNLAGYESQFSDVSPFRRKGRCYDAPNQYHQVGIYCRIPLSRLLVTEPVNGLLCTVDYGGKPLFIYGNVVTIKDQWSKESNKSFSDRLEEQLAMLGRLTRCRFVALGDFNLRLGWSSRKNAFQSLRQFVVEHDLAWPTQMRTDTVQHVLHSSELTTSIFLDETVRDQGLSDHPFVTVELVAG